MNKWYCLLCKGDIDDADILESAYFYQIYGPEMMLLWVDQMTRGYIDQWDDCFIRIGVELPDGDVLYW